MKIKWVKLIVCIAIPILVGSLAGFLSSDSVGIYKDIIRPPLSPPSQVFGIAWTILYTLMGIATYLVITADKPDSDIKKAVYMYAFSLILNFLWPIVFFNNQAYFLALLLIMVLLIVVVLTTMAYFEISPAAGILMIPYVLWLAFATYLNYGIYLLN